MESTDVEMTTIVILTCLTYFFDILQKTIVCEQPIYSTLPIQGLLITYWNNLVTFFVEIDDTQQVMD